MNSKKLRLDTVLFKTEALLAVPCIAAGYWFIRRVYPEHADFFACSFRRITGIPCPGCGGTRALYAFLTGHFTESFLYHPAVLYLAFACIHFTIRYIFRNFIKKEQPSKEIAVPVYAYVLIGVILLQWIFKLLFGFI